MTSVKGLLVGSAGGAAGMWAYLWCGAGWAEGLLAQGFLAGVEARRAISLEDLRAYCVCAGEGVDYHLLKMRGMA